MHWNVCRPLSLSLSITLQRQHMIIHLPGEVLSWKNSQRHISPFQSEDKTYMAWSAEVLKCSLIEPSIHEKNNGELLFFDAKIKFWKPVVLEWKLKAFNVSVSAPRSARHQLHNDSQMSVTHIELLVPTVADLAFDNPFSLYF